MYPIQGKLRTYDLSLVELRLEGEKLVLEPTPGKTTVTRIARTISHNGKLVGVTDEVHQSEAAGPALLVETDGDQAFRVYVSVMQGSHSEDLLAQRAGTGETAQFFLCDKNDEKGIGNSWLFGATVSLPRMIPFGMECVTRVFELTVVEDDGEEGDDEEDDWSTRAFRFDGTVHGRPVVTEVPFNIN